MKSGGDFDKAWIEAQVSDHKKDIEAFEKASNEADDSDVKSLANKMLPTLREHLSNTYDETLSQYAEVDMLAVETCSEQGLTWKIRSDLRVNRSRS